MPHRKRHRNVSYSTTDWPKRLTELRRVVCCAEPLEQTAQDGDSPLDWFAELMKITLDSFCGMAARDPSAGEAATAIYSGETVRIRLGMAAGLKWCLAAGYSWHYAAGNWDVFFQSFLKRLLRTGDIFFDLGAHGGFFALCASRVVGSNGRVVCFEPDPGNLATIATQIRVNGLDNITVCASAIGRTTRNRRFYKGVTSADGGLIHRTGTWATVEVLSLKEAARRFGTPAVVKVDVEGAEMEVVLGGLTLLKSKNPPALLLELHTADPARSIVRLLDELGYKYWFRRGGDLRNISPAAVEHLCAVHERDPRLELIAANA
jgi:FkbM family methyltransferase